jgi:hypothetical protein
MPANPDKTESQKRLNDLRSEFRRRLATERVQETYIRLLHEQAIEIHKTIKNVCESGMEVWAYKDSGRILKMGAVGPLKGTKIPHTRGGRLNHEEHSDIFEECELAVVKSFEIHSGP